MTPMFQSGQRGMLSVLLVTNTYPTETEPGATPCIRDQVLALRQLGVRVEVLAIERRHKLNYLKAALQMLALNLGPRRYDLVHAHYGHSAALALLQRRYPLVATFHGCDLLSRREGAMGRWVARRVDGVIVMSEEMKQVSGRTDARVIPFGVDTGHFYPAPKAQARERLGLDLKARYLLFPYDPSRPVKRFDRLQATVDTLARRGLEVEILAIHDATRDRMRDYMNAADLMVLTSDHEGSPMAVREALVCGLPVVSVDVGDVADLLRDLPGCAIADKDPVDLADKIQPLLLSRPAPEAVSHPRALDALSVAAQVLDLYRQLPLGQAIAEPRSM